MLSADIQRYDTTTDPTLLYDSWVTIGAEDNYMNAVSGFIMDFESFNAGGELATNDGAWFVTPDKRQAAAPPSKRILLMQLTTAGEVEGVLNVHGRTRPVTDADGNVVGGQEVIQTRTHLRLPEAQALIDRFTHKKGVHLGRLFCCAIVKVTWGPSSAGCPCCPAARNPAPHC